MPVYILRLSDAHNYVPTIDLELESTDLYDAIFESYYRCMENGTSTLHTNILQYEVALLESHGIGDNEKFKTIYEGNFRNVDFSSDELEQIELYATQFIKSHDIMARMDSRKYVRQKMMPLEYMHAYFVYKNLVSRDTSEISTVRLMLVFETMRIVQMHHRQDYDLSKRNQMHTIHMSITPTNGHHYDAQELYYITSAFDHWDYMHRIDNFSLHESIAERVICSFDVADSLAIIRTMHQWLNNHKIPNKFNGIAYSLKYDYIEFESGNEAGNTFMFKCEDFVDPILMMERNKLSELYESLYIHYESDA